MTTAGLVRSYDSALNRTSTLASLAAVREHRPLLRLLFTRDLVVRYKRSFLGPWWNLIYPLVTSAVLWIVFARIFQVPQKSFLVYVVSGTVIVSCFTTTVTAATVSLVENAPVLGLIRAPAAAFPIASAAAAALSSAVGVCVVVAAVIVTGTSLSPGVAIVPLVVASLAALGAGTGLLLAPIAVRFHDVIDFARIGLQLLTYATPVFYPIALVPSGYRTLIDANPVTHYLAVFRYLIYHGADVGLASWLVVAFAGPAMLILGVSVFGRQWRGMAGWL